MDSLLAFIVASDDPSDTRPLTWRKAVLFRLVVSRIFIGPRHCILVPKTYR